MGHSPKTGGEYASKWSTINDQNINIQHSHI